ncbi:MAG TPA: 4Fe-4S dicluster domain-containing protein [Candidatus Bathyarchaeia archaeon]|nr:4Fe-4S dicluster domain-containing protein [Candidatus Bathyarchaeia archaeon]
MPLKTIKKDTSETLSLEWVLHVKDYRLTLDKKRCVSCQICSLACPKEAIKIEKLPKIEGGKTRKAKIDVDLTKCNFCGICDILCPYGAIKVTMNGKHALSVVDKDSFPQLVRDIQADASKCTPACIECEEACPLDLIKLTWLTPEGKTVEDAASLSEADKARLKAKIDVQKDYCPCCRVCEIKCPEGIMHVKKFLSGKISIRLEKCPKGCKDCLDVCPIAGALYLSEKDGKVHVDEMFCVYCGACKLVCPVNEALDLKRTNISHTAIRSGAWNKSLERLTSVLDLSKELRSKGRKTATKAVEKLLEPRRK